MRLLVDSHALIWYVDEHKSLSKAAADAISDEANELLLSAGTIWELGIKVGVGKLKLSRNFGEWMAQAIVDLRLHVLPITVEYTEGQLQLPNHHRDPFDRLLIAQARVEQVSVVSNDPVFDQYGVARIW